MVRRQQKREAKGPFSRTSSSKEEVRAARKKAMRENKTVRYAVIGLGHIAQVAVLPAFKNASKNSQLVALVSGDQVKLKELGRRYHVPIQASYGEYDAL